MKTMKSATLATWMIEHVAPMPHSSALAGDLFEELSSGRSLVWYWRQVSAAIATGVFIHCRARALPLAFSACWSTLYPLWLSLWNAHAVQSSFHRWSALDWPYSALSGPAHELLPACTFVWTGLLIYWPLRSAHTGTPSISRLFGSLSLSFNVLLVAIIVLRGPFQPALSYLHLLALETTGLTPYYMPLVLSLLTAILTALPPTRGRHPATSSTA